MGVEQYSRVIERFTWREQTNDEGDKILSSVYNQTRDNCAAFAIGATFEARLRVQGINTTLSKEWIEKHLDTSSPQPRPKVWLMLKALMNQGAVTEHEYDIMQLQGMTHSYNSYNLSGCEAYSLRDARQLLKALKDLITNGPLVAVLQISINYHDCFQSKHVYRFDPSRAKMYLRNGILIVKTHAVCVVGFGNVEGVPCLECQDSRGREFSTNGFLYVDITSIVELYSLYV